MGQLDSGNGEGLGEEGKSVVDSAGAISWRQYINDGGYQPSDAALEQERVQKSQKSNSAFYQTLPPDSASDMNSSSTLTTFSLRNIDNWEELKVVFCSSYNFIGT